MRQWGSDYMKASAEFPFFCLFSLGTEVSKREWRSVGSVSVMKFLFVVNGRLWYRYLHVGWAICDWFYTSLRLTK